MLTVSQRTIDVYHQWAWEGKDIPVTPDLFIPSVFQLPPTLRMEFIAVPIEDRATKSNGLSRSSARILIRHNTFI